MKKFAIGLVAFLGMAMIGCGGDEESGSGVEASKALTEVTPQEAASICEYAQGQISDDDLKTVGCYIFGSFFSEDEAQCEASVQECLNAPADPADGTLLECVATTQADIDALPACASDVTVGELESCQAAMARSFSDAADDISCGNALTVLLNVPDECSALMTDCSDLFGAEL